MPPLPQEREGEKGLSPSVARIGKVGRNATPRGGTREESRTRNQNSELRPKAALETEGGRRQEEKAGREAQSRWQGSQGRRAGRRGASIQKGKAAPIRQGCAKVRRPRQRTAPTKEDEDGIDYNAEEAWTGRTERGREAAAEDAEVEVLVEVSSLMLMLLLPLCPRNPASVLHQEISETRRSPCPRNNSQSQWDEYEVEKSE